MSRGGRFNRSGRQFRRTAVNLDEYSIYPKEHLDKLTPTTSITDSEKDLVDFHRDLVNFYVNPTESNYRVSLKSSEYEEGALRSRLLSRLGADFFPAELLARKISGVRPLASLHRQKHKSLKALEAAEGKEDEGEEEEELEISEDEVSNADYEITGEFEDGGDDDGGGGEVDGDVI